MASNVTVVNRALAFLGEQAITLFTDNSKAARLANAHYNDIRDTFLREHPWNFAQKRVSLAANATGPDWGFSNYFTVPSDLLRMLEANGETDGFHWKIETAGTGRLIATSLAAPLEILYIARIEAEDYMDPAFRTALSARIAMEWAENISGDANKTKDMEDKYNQMLSIARVADGQEQTPVAMEVTTWTNARF